MKKLSLAFGLCLIAPLALACLWDTDTLQEEALGQQEVADIVTGKIIKHSAYFYEQKLEYTLPLLEAKKVKPERYDDLAVAYDKLGKQDEAIKVMEDKEAKFPGLYTTYANLGTFYAHKGDYEKALELLNKAIEINPKAHFGREKYQVKAIEFMLALQKDETLLERQELLGSNIDPGEHSIKMLRGGTTKKARDQQRKKTGVDAAKALAGIIRFGNGEKSQHIWFSLGLVLAKQGDRNLSVYAFRQAELLGHPMAALYGLAAYEGTAVPSKGVSELWVSKAKSIDKDFDANQTLMKEQQDKEDALIKAGKQKKVFGY